MKVVKVNHRHYGYRKWAYFLQFGKNGYLKTEQSKYNKAFTQLFGADRIAKPYEPGTYIWNNWTWNENWYNDGKRFRIYFKNESDMSAISLLL